MKMEINIPDSLYANLKSTSYGSIASRRILDCVKAGKRSEEVTNKGEWIELPNAFNVNEKPCECSKCGHILSFMNGYPKSNFCPDCGADMRGDKAE